MAAEKSTRSAADGEIKAIGRGHLKPFPQGSLIDAAAVTAASHCIRDEELNGRAEGPWVQLAGYSELNADTNDLELVDQTGAS